MKKSKGFTLLELLVTIAIVGVLAAVAVPSFNGLIANTRLTSTTNSLVGALNLARSEAVESNAQIRVEPIAGGGFQLRNLTSNDIVREFAGPADDITITASGPSVVYQANGYRAFGSPVFTLEVCNSEGDSRQIIVATGGSISVVNSTC